VRFAFIILAQMRPFGNYEVVVSPVLSRHSQPVEGHSREPKAYGGLASRLGS